MGRRPEIECERVRHELVIKDHARGDDLGYHIEGGKPVGYIFARDDKETEGEYTSTLSHELLEMIADSDANLYSAGKFRLNGKSRTGFFALEACDPVQENYYKISGVRVQDFVRPEWFEQDHKKNAMRMDHMGVVDAPFTLAKPGYADVFCKRRWHSLTGPKANFKRRRHRLQMRIEALR